MTAACVVATGPSGVLATTPIGGSDSGRTPADAPRRARPAPGPTRLQTRRSDADAVRRDTVPALPQPAAIGAGRCDRHRAAAGDGARAVPPSDSASSSRPSTTSSPPLRPRPRRYGRPGSRRSCEPRGGAGQGGRHRHRRVPGATALGPFGELHQRPAEPRARSRPPCRRSSSRPSDRRGRDSLYYELVKRRAGRAGPPRRRSTPPTAVEQRDRRPAGGHRRTVHPARAALLTLQTRNAGLLGTAVAARDTYEDQPLRRHGPRHERQRAAGRTRGAGGGQFRPRASSASRTCGRPRGRTRTTAPGSMWRRTSPSAGQASARLPLPVPRRHAGAGEPAAPRRPALLQHRPVRLAADPPRRHVHRRRQDGARAEHRRRRQDLADLVDGVLRGTAHDPGRCRAADARPDAHAKPDAHPVTQPERPPSPTPTPSPSATKPERHRRRRASPSPTRHDGIAEPHRVTKPDRRRPRHASPSPTPPATPSPTPVRRDLGPARRPTRPRRSPDRPELPGRGRRRAPQLPPPPPAAVGRGTVAAGALSSGGGD